MALESSGDGLSLYITCTLYLDRYLTYLHVYIYLTVLDSVLATPVGPLLLSHYGALGF